MGSKGGSTTTGSFSPPPEFTKAYKEALGMARGATSRPYEQYSGNLVAGLTPSQTQGISNINNAQGMALPAIQRGMQYTEQAAQGVTPELYDRFYSPYVKDVANTTFSNLMESQAQQQSNLKSGAIQSGAFGGDRARIGQGEMARQQQLGNAMAMSNIYNQGYGQAMGLAGQQVANLGSMGQQIAGLGAGAQASVLQGAQAQMAAGAQQQATEQARLQAAYDQWTQRQAYPYQQAQFFANIAQGLGAGAGGTSSTTQPAPNMFSQIMGGVGAIGSIYGASDKRVKENIEPVGTLNDGQTIYRYNFKGSPKTEIGLLAQEVEDRKPGSVAQVNGLKMVNYKDATEDAAEMSSAGGFVAPSEYRQGLAGGGVPFYPYADARTYVPEGKFDVRGNNMPDPPKPFEDKGLAEDWKNISPLSKEQASGLRELAGDVGLDLPEKGDISKIFKSGVAVGPTEAETAWIYKTNPDEGLLHTRLASGGVAARHGYADGGYEPSRIDEALAESEGLGAAMPPEVDPRLARMESGGDFGAKNEQGYVGRMQFGPDRLTDAKRAGIIPADMSSEGFRGDENAQKATEAWHFGDINNFIDKSGLAAVEGKSIKGIPVTRKGLVNVAHLGGKTGLQKFVASGGRYDPADANGKRLSDYLAMASNEGGVGGAMPVPASAEGLSAVAEPAAVEGLGGAEEPKTGLNFDMKKLFASDENPSLIEKVMGRRLSPEARSAVLNASFALMAGRSPFFATNLGEAGKVGTQTYYNALKQGADISRQGYEAQTGRMQVDVAERNAARQQAALVLPYVKNLIANGQPVPDYLMRMIEDGSPGAMDELRRGKTPEGLSTAPTETVSPVIGGPPPAPGPAAQTEGATSVQPPLPGGVQPQPVNSEAESLLSQLPEQQRPSYFYDAARRLASAGGSPEEVMAIVKQGNDLLQGYIEDGIPLPSGGLVMFPGKEQRLRTEKAIDLDVENVSKFDTGISDIQSGLSSRKVISEGLRESLSKAETGKFASFKSDLVSALNTFGMATPEQLAEAADIQTAMKYFAQSVLDSGMKDKIGPQISNADLQLVATGTGSVENIAAANRRIVGAVYGKLMHDEKKAEEWNKFVLKRGGLDKIKSVDVREWQIKFGDQYKLSEFVKEGIKNTPVKGEVSLDTPIESLKAGYKYVMPDGKIKLYTGIEEDGFFSEVE